jgi:flagellar L-ring protein precursor FlgH
MSPLRSLLIPIVALLAAGCVSHVKPYQPKKRRYNLPVPHAAFDAGKSKGSLFDPSGVGMRLTTDARAQAVNDVVVVIIDEQATARRNTGTETTRQDSQSLQLTNFLSLVAKLQKENPDFKGETAVQLAQAASFKGEGKTSRSDQLKATVPAMVRQVLPNGNLFIEGHRVVLLNQEENHFYISGVIRPEDIDGAGQVTSSRIADAQIEFTGRGDLSSASTKGWLSRLLDVIWPF